MGRLQNVAPASNMASFWVSMLNFGSLCDFLFEVHPEIVYMIFSGIIGEFSHWNSENPEFLHAYSGPAWLFGQCFVATEERSTAAEAPTVFFWRLALLMDPSIAWGNSALLKSIYQLVKRSPWNQKRNVGTPGYSRLAVCSPNIPHVHYITHI